MRLSPPQSRLRSLDAYRGITIAAMILVNDPGAVENTYPALLHAPWTGWTFADTIFPAFLWIIGVSITLSTAARLARGDDRGTLLRHGLQRSALLFLIGIALSDLTFPVRTFPYFRFEDYLPLTGVLQKIAVCYLAATAIFLWTTWRGVIAWIIGLSAVYVALMSLFTVPNCNAGTWTVDCNFAGYIDRVLLEGHLWRNDAKQDPDGLGSLLPAITSVLFGVLAGYVLKADARPSGQVGPAVGSQRDKAEVRLGFTKVLSPQYVVWLIPLVPFGGIAAMLLLLAALALAQSWYFHYHDLWAVGPQAWTLLSRNLVLVALYALLLWKTSTPSSEKTSRQSGLSRSRASAAAEGSGATRSA